MAAENIRKLAISESIHLKHGAGGMVVAKESVTIPDGYVGILSVRRMFGNNKLSLTSQFLESGFTGQPELHLLNMGNDLDLLVNEPVANIVIVKGLFG